MRHLADLDIRLLYPAAGYIRRCRIERTQAMSVQTQSGSLPVRLIKETVNDWMQDGALRLSAALAYYSVFSIAPLLIIAISIAGWALGPEAVTGQLDNQMKSYIGAEAAEAVQSLVKGAASKDDSLLGGIIGFATLMIGASGIFGQLKDALNTIWEVKPKSGLGIMGFIRDRILNFSMVLVIGFLLLVSLTLTTALAAASDFMSRIFELPAPAWGIIGFVFSFGMVTLLFAFIFKLLPDAKIEWRNVWVGAVLTALLFELGKFGLSFYLGRESTASSFGAAGSVVLLLLWVYYASAILLLGAEFTQVYAKATGHNIQPAANAEPVTKEERVQQGLDRTESTQAHEGSGVPEVWAPGDRQVSVLRRQLPVLAPAPGAATPGKVLAVLAASYVLGTLLKKHSDRA